MDQHRIAELVADDRGPRKSCEILVKPLVGEQRRFRMQAVRRAVEHEGPTGVRKHDRRTVSRRADCDVGEPVVVDVARGQREAEAIIGQHQLPDAGRALRNLDKTRQSARRTVRDVDGAGATLAAVIAPRRADYQIVEAVTIDIARGKRVTELGVALQTQERLCPDLLAVPRLQAAIAAVQHVHQAGIDVFGAEGSAVLEGDTDRQIVAAIAVEVADRKCAAEAVVDLRTVGNAVDVLVPVARCGYLRHRIEHRQARVVEGQVEVGVGVGGERDTEAEAARSRIGHERQYRPARAQRSRLAPEGEERAHVEFHARAVGRAEAPQRNLAGEAGAVGQVGETLNMHRHHRCARRREVDALRHDDVGAGQGAQPNRGKIWIGCAHRTTAARLDQSGAGYLPG